MNALGYGSMVRGSNASRWAAVIVTASFSFVVLGATRYGENIARLRGSAQSQAA